MSRWESPGSHPPRWTSWGRSRLNTHTQDSPSGSVEILKVKSALFGIPQTNGWWKIAKTLHISVCFLRKITTMFTTQQEVATLPFKSNTQIIFFWAYIYAWWMACQKTPSTLHTLPYSDRSRRLLGCICCIVNYLLPHLYNMWVSVLGFRMGGVLSNIRTGGVLLHSDYTHFSCEEHEIRLCSAQMDLLNRPNDDRQSSSAQKSKTFFFLQILWIWSLFRSAFCKGFLLKL